MGGTLSFDGGMDSGRSANAIDANQVAFAVNCVFRGGKTGCRHGIKKLALDIPSDIKSAFRHGRFQHAAFYDGNGIPSLMSSHGGRQFRIDLRNLRVSEITPSGDGGNNPNAYIGWSVQAENYWIYQDNQSLPIIHDGASSRRSNLARLEVPVGNVMAYAMGRIVVSLTDRVSFRAGDLLFSSSGTPALNYRDSILRFTENNYLNEGGDFMARVFGAPSNSGRITMMKAGSMADTQLGQGPLIVGTPLQVFTVNLPFDRTQWKNMASPLQTVNPILGPMGQNSTVLVNSDLWYRGIDGIRSYIMARRDFSTVWGNAPMSSEINETLSQDTQSLLEHGSAVLFDNRLICTISPTKVDRGVWHRGMVAIDFNPISGIGKRAHPAWDGLWTGPKILQLVTGIVNNTERCFIYGIDQNDSIGLWEIVRGAKVDDEDTAINRQIEFASYACGDPDQFKRLETGRIILQEISGDVTGTVKYRSDQNPCWQNWTTFSVCSKTQDCAVENDVNCTGPHTYKPQVRSQIKFTMPPDTFDTINRRKFRTGYEFQPRLELSGYAELKQLRIYCEDEPETLAPSERNLS